MNVSEFISFLSKVPPDTEIVCPCFDHDYRNAIPVLRDAERYEDGSFGEFAKESLMDEGSTKVQVVVIT